MDTNVGNMANLSVIYCTTLFNELLREDGYESLSEKDNYHVKLYIKKTKPFLVLPIKYNTIYDSDRAYYGNGSRTSYTFDVMESPSFCNLM